jgi:hypothetical protein
MSLSSLEAERQSILDRMKMRRDTYRRMLTDGTDLNAEAVTRIASDGSPMTVYRHNPAPTHFPRSTLMRTIMDHPFLCAVGVAAVVAIGPRRIIRTVTSSTAAVGALTAGNQSNIDMIGKLLTMAGAYAQGRSNHPPSR